MGMVSRRKDDPKRRCRQKSEEGEMEASDWVLLCWRPDADRERDEKIGQRKKRKNKKLPWMGT